MIFHQVKCLVVAESKLPPQLTSYCFCKYSKFRKGSGPWTEHIQHINCGAVSKIWVGTQPSSDRGDMVWCWWKGSVSTVWRGNQWASAPAWCHCDQATESQHPWVPLPPPFPFSNVILSLCTLKGLTSAQTDILCSGREGEREEKVKWVTTGYLEMSSWRWKLFFLFLLMDNVLFPPLLSSPLQSGLSTWDFPVDWF